MEFYINQEDLIKSLQKVISLVSSRPSLSILSNLLIEINENNAMLITSSNLDMQLTAKVILSDIISYGSTTISAKKFYSIWKEFPLKTRLRLKLNNDTKFLISYKKIKFSISTLPIVQFPVFKNLDQKVFEFFIPEFSFRKLIEVTYFSIANQDTRHFLNGMLLEFKNQKLKAVSTDGHRLSYSFIKVNKEFPSFSIIIPKIGIMELLRLLRNTNNLFKLEIYNNHVCAYISNFIFTSKLIDASFPNYQQILKKKLNNILIIDSEKLKKALYRASIISSDKFKVVHFIVENNVLLVISKNSNKEKFEESIKIDYQGSKTEIYFNINYILDILNFLISKKICFLFEDSESGVRVEDLYDKSVIYIIMPVRV